MNQIKLLIVITWILILNKEKRIITNEDYLLIVKKKTYPFLRILRVGEKVDFAEHFLSKTIQVKLCELKRTQ